MFFRPDLESTLQPMNSSSRKRLSRRRREVSGHVVIRSVQRKRQRSGRVRTLTHATAGAAVDQRRRSLSLLTLVSTSNVNFDDATIYGQPSAGPPLHQRSREPGGVRPPLLTMPLNVSQEPTDYLCVYLITERCKIEN